MLFSAAENNGRRAEAPPSGGAFTSGSYLSRDPSSCVDRPGCHSGFDVPRSLRDATPVPQTLDRRRARSTSGAAFARLFSFRSSRRA